MRRAAVCLLFACAIAQPQAINVNPNPTSNPNQINVTPAYLFLTKMHYAGTWGSSATYNSQDVVFYSGAAYISLQPGNLNNNPASASLWWILIPGSAGGSAAWGSITGTLSSQTDLGTALGAKLASASNLSDLANAGTARTNLGLAAVAASGSASDLGSGTLPAARLPNPSATTLGGVKSLAAVSHNWINTISTSGAPAATQPACADLSNAAASCSTDATNASNIGSGTLPAARLPNPSASTLGGVESLAVVSHQWINTISTAGVPAATQPACADLSDSGSSCKTNTGSYCAPASASGTAYACTPAIPLPSYITGLVLSFFPDVNSTGGSTTLAVSLLGTKPVKQSDCSTNPTSTTFVASTQYLLAYNGTVFCAQPTLAAVATSGSASDLGTGTLPAARLPNPSASTLGGIESYVAVSNQFIDSISTAGVPHSRTIATGDVPTLNQSTSGNAGTATALAANGTNCSAGNYPLGVDASGNAESCTAVAPGVTVTTGTSATLSTPYTFNQEGTAAQAVAYTLPTASAGAQYCVDNSYNGSAANTGALTVNASASGQFIVFTDGTLSATGGNVLSGGAARDGACFAGIDATHWMFYPHSPSGGTWAKH